jgi:hypothetical protein
VPAAPNAAQVEVAMTMTTSSNGTIATTPGIALARASSMPDGPLPWTDRLRTVA